MSDKTKMFLCPSCQREMELGYIRSHGEVIAWTPEDEKDPCLRWQTSKNAIRLGDYLYVTGCKVTAYHCKYCGFVLIKTKE